jgi:hypothetical protein
MQCLQDRSCWCCCRCMLSFVVGGRGLIAWIVWAFSKRSMCNHENLSFTLEIMQQVHLQGLPAMICDSPAVGTIGAGLEERCDSLVRNRWSEGRHWRAGYRLHSTLIVLLPDTRASSCGCDQFA